MLTIGLGLSAALSYAVSDFLAQRVTRGGATVVATLTWVLATGAVITVPVAVAVGRVPHGGKELTDVGYAAAGGALYLVAYASLVRGLRVGNISLVTPLASLQGAVAAVLAVLLFAEKVIGLTAVGLGLAVVGGLLAATGPRDPEGRRAEGVREGGQGRSSGHSRVGAATGAGWGLLSALAFGAVLVSYGAISSLSPITAVAVSRLVSLGLVLPFALRSGVEVPRPLRATALVSGALEASGFMLLVLALAVGPVAVASVLVAQFATFAVLLGLLVNRERPARVQLVGVALTISAVTVLALV